MLFGSAFSGCRAKGPSWIHSLWTSGLPIHIDMALPRPVRMPDAEPPEGNRKAAESISIVNGMMPVRTNLHNVGI